MISVQQGLAAGNHPFSFSSPIHITNDCSDELKLDAWTGNFKGGPWNRGVGGGYDYYHGRQCSHAFSWLADDGDSTVESPPSEKNAGSPASQTYPMEDYSDKQEHPCCNSRARAIARCREEMLAMVKDMPEFAYELSLRDLVELPKIVNSMQEANEKGKEDEFRIGEEQRKGKKGKKRTLRSERTDNGFFLLKVFFLHSLGGRRKRSATSGSSKIMSKPMLTEGEKGLPEKTADGEWFEENELSDLGENNGIIDRSRSRSRSRRMNGCYSFFQSSRSYAREI